MRIRTIKPEFWTHPVMAKRSDSAQLLALGLLNYCDDEGFFFADAMLIRAALRPFDEDSTKVRRSIDELSRIGFIELRSHPSHGQVGCVTGFSDHQRIDRPQKSKVRPLFESAQQVAQFDERSTNARRTLDDDSLLEGKGMDQGMDQGMATVARRADDSSKPESGSKTRKPNPHFDAMLQLEGLAGVKLNDGEAGRIGKALKLIRQSDPEVTPRMIEVRGMAYAKAMKGLTITAMGLANNWAKYRDAEDPLENDGRPICLPVGDGDPR